MNELLTQVVISDDAGKRLDYFIGQMTGESRVQAKRYIDFAGAQVDGAIVTKSSIRIKEGQTVTVDVTVIPKKKPEQIAEELASLEDLDIEIVRETDEYVVVHKPAGLLVHKTNKNEVVTLAAWLHKQYPDIAEVGEGEFRAGLVHRLDKQASGLLVVAKTQPMHDALKKQFQDRTVDKEYSVLVHGNIEINHDVILFPIDRGSDGHMVARPLLDPTNLRMVAKLQPGKDAKTEFWVEHHYFHYSLLRVKIHTGRTHQIRVHMFAYNHPVAGDTLYKQKKIVKNEKQTLPRLFLHAAKLGFTDLAGERIEVTLPLPDQLQEYLSVIK
ncbi:MAG: RluA family pseudouridine synthase [Candidatus Magasanikbacteria bacterium]|jgi:23S rRNA pseudouridine1911/1915/1917 synthase|nr:RluA family pseudouridine synthase [Candidatus Magasanikbacteria bacterium]